MPLTSVEYQEEIILKLNPKIRAVLRQTSVQNINDLEQELNIKIIQKVKEGTSSNISFFELVK